MIKNFGENHHGLAIIYGNMGNIFLIKGELNKALEYQEKSREIYIKNFGVNHYELTITYGNMGNIFERKGEIDKGLEY